MNHFKKSLKLFWAPAAIVCLLFASYGSYTDRKERLRQQIESVENSLTGIEKDLAESQGVVDLYLVSRRDLEPYISSLFSVKEPESLIGRIDDTASLYKVRLADIRLDVPKFIEVRGKTESISIVPCEASFTGNFFSLGEFVAALEKEPYLLIISETGMVISEESGNVLKMSLKGAFRFFKSEMIEELRNHGD